MKAVVMAGGEGSRLRPLTSRRPKPLAPVANKPVMEHIVDLLRRHGVKDIVATLHYLADEIESYFGDGRDFGVRMSYVVEDTPLGTAGAVKMVMAAGRPDSAAIASRVAASIYGGKILRRSIEDDRHNFTRFFLLYSSKRLPGKQPSPALRRPRWCLRRGISPAHCFAP